MNNKISAANVIKFAGAYIAYIIGSGFATGQEIIQFFTSQGVYSVGAILISMFLYSWCGSTLTGIGSREADRARTHPYQIICGKYLGTFYEYFVPIFLFMVVVVMISGAGATIHEYYGLSYYVGSALMAALIFVAFACGFNKLIDIIGCIGPAIIVFSIIVAVGTLIQSGSFQLAAPVAELAEQRAASNWAVSGGLYAAYNIFGSIPFLMMMGVESASRKEVQLGGAIGGILLMVAVLFMNAALCTNPSLGIEYAVPTLQMAKNLSPILGVIFSVLLLCGIFSTAAPMMWTVCTKITPEGSKKSIIICGVLSLVGFFFGQLPFGTLVGILYPYTGYLGFIAIACLAIYAVRQRKSSRPDEKIHTAAAQKRV